MSTSTPSRLLTVLTLILSLTTGAYAATVSKIESLGEKTYAITRTATSGFDRNVGQFKNEAEQDVAKYGTENGKVIKILSVTTDRPRFGSGFAWAKVVFKALDENDPELTAPPETASSQQSASGAVAPAGVLPTYAGDFYSELLKLDDLRKRGLLTDKEFEKEKKKLLKKFK